MVGTSHLLTGMILQVGMGSPKFSPREAAISQGLKGPISQPVLFLHGEVGGILTELGFV